MRVGVGLGLGLGSGLRVRARVMIERQSAILPPEVTGLHVVSTCATGRLGPGLGLCSGLGIGVGLGLGSGLGSGLGLGLELAADRRALEAVLGLARVRVRAVS